MPDPLLIPSDLRAWREQFEREAYLLRRNRRFPREQTEVVALEYEAAAEELLRLEEVRA